jgi:hypothetical protein
VNLAILLLNLIYRSWIKIWILSFKPVKYSLMAKKIYIDDAEDNESFRIEFGNGLFSFEFISLKSIFKNSLPRHILGFRRNQFHWIRNIVLLSDLKFHIDRSCCVSIQYI